MKMIRMMALTTCLMVAFASNLLRAEQSSIPSVENLDGICKLDKVPIGYVPVGEFHSGACASANPVEMNAWYVDKIHDGIVSCTIPDYVSGYPPVIGYTVCQKKLSASCPMRLDGGPNAYELTIPQNCEGRRVVSVCRGRRMKAKYLYENIRGWTLKTFEDPTCATAANNIVEIRVDCDHSHFFCVWYLDEKSNTRIVRMRLEMGIDCKATSEVWPCVGSEREQFPVCIALNAEKIAAMQEQNDRTIGRVASEFQQYGVKDRRIEREVEKMVDRDLVIRRFYADYCPTADSGPNALIVRRVGSSRSSDDNIAIACDISFLPEKVSDGSWNHGLKLTRLHDDRCGEEVGLNSVTFILPER